MPSPSPFVDRRRFTIRFFTARDGGGGGAGLDGVAAPPAAALLALTFDVGCERRLRVVIVGESRVDGDVEPNSEPEKVIPGERGEQGLPQLGLVLLPVPPLITPVAGGG